MGSLFRFLAARAVPAVVSFAAIVVFTRLLSREEFGIYSVALASANVATALLFHWLGLAAVRFGIVKGVERAEYLSAILFLYAIAIALSLFGFLAAVALLGWPFGRTVAIGAALVLFDSWFVLNQRLAIAVVAPTRLAVMSTAKALIGLAAGAWAAAAGLGGSGVLSGAALGSACAGVLPMNFKSWNGVGLRRVTRRHLSDVFRYGGPLGVTVAFGYALTAIDRTVLTSFHGAHAAGEYAASFDLASSAVVLALSSVNWATFPRMLESADGDDRALTAVRLRDNLDLLLLFGLPIVAVLMCLAPNVSAVVLGGDFARAAATTMPWIAAGAFLGAVRSFHFDAVFHLEKDARTILKVVAGVLLVNAALNVLLVPRWGVPGAVAAMIASQCVGVGSSYLAGRGRRTPAPAPDIESLKMASAAAFAVMLVWPLASARGGLALCGQLLVVGLTYWAGLLTLRSRVATDASRRIVGALRRVRARGTRPGV